MDLVFRIAQPLPPQDRVVRVGEKLLLDPKNAIGRGYRLHLHVLFRSQARALHLGVVDAGFQKHHTDILSLWNAIAEIEPDLLRVGPEHFCEVACK